MSLESLFGPNEHILWFGKKNKKVSVWESIFNPMLPIAALFGICDFGFITLFELAIHSSPSDNVSPGFVGFLRTFFLLHLMPVWMYLGGMLTSAVKAKYTNYCVTDQAVYIQHGIFSKTTIRITYQQVFSVDINQSFFDKRASTGDVVLKLDELEFVGVHSKPRQREIKIENISDYESLYQIIMEYQSLFASGMSGDDPQDMLSYMQQHGDQPYGHSKYDDDNDKKYR